MGVWLERLCVAIAAAVATLVVAPRADAKPPLVVVKTEFGPNAVYLKERIADDLLGDSITKTPEEFITEQFIAVIRPLRMFEFRSASQAQSEYVVSLVIDATPTFWPLGDVYLTVTSDDVTFESPFCFRAACSEPNCVPNSFSSVDFYRSKFKSLFADWPDRFLKHIPLSIGATLQGGRILLPEPLSDFGQPLFGPPTALFELVNGSVQREFVLCRANAGRAEGDDHGTQALPSCSHGYVRPPLFLQGLGRVSLLKGLL